MNYYTVLGEPAILSNPEFILNQSFPIFKNQFLYSFSIKPFGIIIKH